MNIHILTHAYAVYLATQAALCMVVVVKEADSPSQGLYIALESPARSFIIRAALFRGPGCMVKECGRWSMYPNMFPEKKRIRYQSAIIVVFFPSAELLAKHTT